MVGAETMRKNMIDDMCSHLMGITFCAKCGVPTLLGGAMAQHNGAISVTLTLFFGLGSLGSSKPAYDNMTSNMPATVNVYSR